MMSFKTYLSTKLSVHSMNTHLLKLILLVAEVITNLRLIQSHVICRYLILGFGDTHIVILGFGADDRNRKHRNLGAVPTLLFTHTRCLI